MFKLAFQIVPFAVALLLMAVFVLPAGLKARARAVWAVALFACASKFLLFRAIGGDVFNPELYDVVIWILNWAYSGMFILLALALPWALAARLARRAAWLARARRAAVWALPLLAWALALKGLYNGIKAPEVVAVEVAFADLPDGLDGYRILQISDLHVSAAARRGRTAAVVARANAAGADLAVVTGDIVDGPSARQARNVEPLRELRAKDGVYFATGNHEYYSDPWGWKAQYAAWGLRFLANEWVSPRPGLVLGGVDDPACVFNPKGLFFADLPSRAKAFAGAPEGAFRVLLQHRPYVNYAALGEDAAERVDLQLSGHTHGGIAPGLRALVRLFNHGFVRGLYRRADGAAVYVSPGAGQWAGFPIRFLNDPEITLITLRRAAKENLSGSARSRP